MSVRPRVWLLVASAVILIAVTAWDYSQPTSRISALPVPASWQPLPRELHFELYDVDNRTVRLARYLGRHRILVVFFDGREGADRDDTVVLLRERFDELKRQDVIVVGVSSALPQEIRRAYERGGEFPFPLLSDHGGREGTRAGEVHEAWGVALPGESESGRAVFLVDRAGRIAWNASGPRPLHDPRGVIERLAQPG